jgi:hypothetical protein
MGDAVSKRIRLARPGAGDDQERRSDMTIGSDSMFDGSTLLWIEHFEI